MMLLIMTSILAGVVYYCYSTTLLGKYLGVNTPVTTDNLQVEAYNWDALTRLVLNVRNVGTSSLNFATADWFVGGVRMGVSVTNPSGGTCSSTSTVSPNTLCIAALTISGLTVSSGAVYTARVIFSDGSTFSTSLIAGQVTGETG